jgi:deazaflavin-dependent oxidoreductase (nitroreductase family)
MWYNSVVAALLNSPLHGVMSGSMMLITFQGRKSGKTYTTPVEYLRQGDALFVVSRREHTWWRNLVGANGTGVPVMLHLQGKDVQANARAVMNEPELTRELVAFYRARPQYAKYLNLHLDANGEPLTQDLASAAQKFVIVRAKL